MRKLYKDSVSKAVATVIILAIVALIPLGAFFFEEPNPGEEGSGDAAEISRMMDELRANSAENGGSKFSVEKYLGGIEK